MNYKSIAAPAPAVGQGGFGPKQVVPNMSLSLQEILERFTRNESLEIGKDPVFDEEGDDDLEKVKTMDLVDRAEYVEKLKKTRDDFEKQERKRKRELDKLAHEEAVKAAADKLAAEQAAASKVKP